MHVSELSALTTIVAVQDNRESKLRSFFHRGIFTERRKAKTNNSIEFRPSHSYSESKCME